MFKIKLKSKKAFAAIAIIAILFSTGIVGLLFYMRDDRVAVSINGFEVYQKEIDVVYQQQKDGIVSFNKEDIIEATIKNTVVRQYGEQQGVSVSADDLKSIIEEYKKTGFYNDALEIYGEDELKRGLYNHEMFVRAKAYILNVCIPPKDISEKDIQRFLDENQLGHMTLSEEEKASIEKKLLSDYLDEQYEDFVANLVKKADVVYY